MANYILRLKGGPGSGNHGHKGIPGHQGGSLPRDGSASNSDYTRDMDGKHMQPEMSDSQILREAKRSLRKLVANTNTWAARDTIKDLANTYLGEEIYILNDDKLASRLAKRLISLDDETMLRMCNDDWDKVMHGNLF